MNNYIKLEDCQHGGVYKIHARNFSIGVFNKNNNGFIGIRTKFGNCYLFTEYHWDTGPPYGTVQPYEELERCNLENLNDDWDNEELSKYLEEIKEKYKDVY